MCRLNKFIIHFAILLDITTTYIIFKGSYIYKIKKINLDFPLKFKLTKSNVELGFYAVISVDLLELTFTM